MWMDVSLQNNDSINKKSYKHLPLMKDILLRIGAVIRCSTPEEGGVMRPMVWVNTVKLLIHFRVFGIPFQLSYGRHLMYLCLRVWFFSLEKSPSRIWPERWSSFLWRITFKCSMAHLNRDFAWKGNLGLLWFGILWVHISQSHLGFRLFVAVGA